MLMLRCRDYDNGTAELHGGYVMCDEFLPLVTEYPGSFSGGPFYAFSILVNIMRSPLNLYVSRTVMVRST